MLSSILFMLKLFITASLSACYRPSNLRVVSLLSCVGSGQTWATRSARRMAWEGSVDDSRKGNGTGLGFVRRAVLSVCPSGCWLLMDEEKRRRRHGTKPPQKKESAKAGSDDALLLGSARDETGGVPQRVLPGLYIIESPYNNCSFANSRIGGSGCCCSRKNRARSGWQRGVCLVGL